MTKGKLFDLKRFAIHDGPGIRMTVFFKGCPLKCWWCHNPEGLRSSTEIDPGKDRVQVSQSETVGSVYSVDELMTEIEKEVIFFDDSGGGVTFSGGEPLYQPHFLQKVLQRCREMDIHTAVDTSGFAPLEVVKEISGLTDLFLYDLKLINDDQHLLYTGVSNQKILKNLRWLAAERKKLIIRFPVIPGITDTEENITGLKRLLAELDSIRHVSLLPFHNIAAGKYERFNVENRLGDLEPLEKEHVLPLKTELEKLDKTVTIGG